MTEEQIVLQILQLEESLRELALDWYQVGGGGEDGTKLFSSGSPSGVAYRKDVRKLRKLYRELDQMALIETQAYDPGGGGVPISTFPPLNEPFPGAYP